MIEGKPHELEITWNSLPSLLYTLIIANLETNYLHCLIVNIPGGNVDSGTVIVPYLAMTTGRYVSMIFAQSSRIESNNVNREKFITSKYQVTNGLRLVEFDIISIDIRGVMYKIKKESLHLTNPATKNATNNVNHPLIKGDTTLTDQQQKFCSCVIHVANKQSDECNQSKFKSGGKCYNPWAVCTKSVGTNLKHCTENYNFNQFDDSELRTYAYIHSIPVHEPYNRESLLNLIFDLKT